MKSFSNRRVWMLIVALAFAAPLASAVHAQTLPVVPNAYGFGMETRAAYGGGGTAPTVFKVTNLNDSGTGSLRQALEAASPRVVVFEISGTISLDSELHISNPYLTVAGQTAPSPGITIRNHGVYVDTHDVLFQHFRIRPGSDTCNSAMLLWGVNTYNVVLDHMTLSWGQDETLAVGNPARPMNVSVWRSIIAEGLSGAAGSANCTGGGTSPGHGFLVYSDSRNVSMMQTLVSSNTERNPYMQANTSTVLVNNLIYQWHGPWGFAYANFAGGSENGSAWYSTVVGNRMIKGPYSTDSTDPKATMFLYLNNATHQDNRIYRADNTTTTTDGSVIEQQNLMSYDPNVSAPSAQAPLPAGYAVLPSTQVQAVVLANAGARPRDRDAADARVVNDVSNLGGRLWVSTTDGFGGYPVLAVNGRTLAVPANPHSTTPSGYTALEVWLQGYAKNVESAAQTETLPAPPTGVRVVTN